MKARILMWIGSGVILAGCLLASPAQAAGWKAGTAKVAITPKTPMWMAGYASRTSPSEGKLHDLWAKALVLEDPSGERAVLVTLDICGITQPLNDQVRDLLKQKYQLERRQIALASSHTHSGPVVGANLITMYPIDAEQLQKIEQYAKTLRDAIVSVVGEAIKNVEPAQLSWGLGTADFAVNRRANNQAKAAELRDQLAQQGPVDHDVPVLRVESGENIKAVVCTYACHCTTLSLNKFNGDYAGYAQIALEKAHPGAQAMFVAGCGADQNPLPRGTVEQAEDYGQQLANAVEQVLSGPLRPISGPLATSYQEINLAFAPVPDRAHWETEAQSKTFLIAGRAKKFLKILDSGEKIPTTYAYPIEVWQLGDGPTWILLGGEVVVDYAHRLKRNLGSSHTWVSSYCNDVMAYIPSLRVLKEGGYEGGGAMAAYGQPAPWSDSVEEDVIAAVRKGVNDVRKP